MRREGEPVERGYPAAELEDGGGRAEDPRGEERVGRGRNEGCEDGVDLPEDYIIKTMGGQNRQLEIC